MWDRERRVWLRDEHRFDAGAPTWEAVLAASPSTPREAEVRVTRVDQGGVAVRGPWQDVAGAIASVRDQVKAERRVRARLWAPRWDELEVRSARVELIYDDGGQLVTGELMDYALPRAQNLVPFELERTVTPCPHNPLGVKGVGEAGAIASPAAVVNAAVDALSHLGIRHIDMPLTPEKVWRAMAAASGKKAAPSGR